MGRALLVLIVAIGTALIVFWLAAPRLLSSHNADATPRSPLKEDIPVETVPSSSGKTADQRESSIEAPQTAEEREYGEIEAKRAPFYAWVRENYAYISSLRPAPTDQATLEIYASGEDPRIVPTLVHEVVAPYGKRYGFRRVRFFLPNPPGNVDRYRLDSESTPDTGGVWNTFRK